MKRTAFFWSLLLSATIASSGWAQTIERSFTASSAGTLDLDLEAGGSVAITAWDQNEVSVRVERDGRDADEVEVSFDERGDTIYVQSDIDEHNGRAEVSYSFRVPSRFNIRLELTGGSVSIRGVSGSIEGETMGGAIELDGLSGTVKMETMGGKIQLSNSDVDGSVHTMGGNIHIEDVNGDVDATTMGGDIIFENVRPSGKRETKVHTMGGDIEVSDAPGGANVQTMGGDISVGDVKEYLKAETMGGNIVADAVDGWIEATTMGGDLTVRMVGDADSGDRHVELESMGGDIELTVPRGLGMDMDVEISVQGRNAHPEDYEIRSDFPMDVRRDNTSGRNRMKIMGEGSTGSGEHSIHIRTVNGSVRIIRGS